jgi:hypothetical protein
MIILKLSISLLCDRLLLQATTTCFRSVECTKYSVDDNSERLCKIIILSFLFSVIKLT